MTIFMALYYDLQIYKDVHSLVLLVFQYTKEFPKEYKFNLGEDLRRDSMDLHLISIRKYAEISRLVDSIGRQINGWRKSFR